MTATAITPELARALCHAPSLTGHEIRISGNPTSGYFVAVAAMHVRETFTSPAAALAHGLWAVREINQREEARQ
jgi:hypothetical protein